MSSSRIEATRRRLRRFAAGLAMVAGATGCGDGFAASVAPDVRATAAHAGFADALLILPDQSSPVMPVARGADVRLRRRALVAALQARALHDQQALRAWLDARGVVHRDFWIVNMIAARL